MADRRRFGTSYGFPFVDSQRRLIDVSVRRRVSVCDVVMSSYDWTSYIRRGSTSHRRPIVTRLYDDVGSQRHMDVAIRRRMVVHPLIFTGEGQKVRNLASFKTSLNYEPPAFENAAIKDIRNLKQKCNMLR